MPHALSAREIPTQDAEAALAFCRALAQLLSANPNASVPPRAARPVLSVVIPVFNEQENLRELYRRLIAALERIENNFEILFVDDGSRDASLEILTQLAQNDARVTVIAFARNFGHQAAISAGLDQARGEGVIVMDADLQDPPEALEQFVAQWRNGHDVVYAVREQRKESWFKRASYALFYRLLQRVANIDIPLDAGDFCIMDRRVVDLLVSMPERNRFVRGIRSWVGLDQVGLKYERAARYAGETKYSYGRLMTLALDGFVSFSFAPLRISSLLGIAISILSIILAIFYAVQKITVGLNPPGFATTIVAILFLAGIQLITIGVIGEYVGRIFEEVKRRPLYVTKSIIKQA
ncbi:MAG: putative glycosyltransferase [Anaerolineae bacterium]|nr:putative glycosyltransferase [Anaerolineae bacterium]